MATSPSSASGVWLRRSLIAVAVISVLYAPIAMTDLFPYRFSGAPRIGESILSAAVSPKYMSEALATRIGPYSNSWMALTVHAVVGGLLMIAGPVQLLSAVRRRKRLHRTVGVFYAIAVYASMAGAAIYLARTPLDGVFSGPLFAFALGAILFGTVSATTLGILEIVSRRPQGHQRQMVLSYAFLMTAPLLRLEWATLPMIFPGLSMDQINRIGTMSLGGIVAFVAVVVSRALDPRSKVRNVTGTWVPKPVLIAAQLAAVVASGAIVWIFAGFDDPQQWRQLAGFFVPFAIAYVVAVILWRRAKSRPWPREEWNIQLSALGLVPAVSLGIAAVVRYVFGFDAEVSIGSGLAIGWGATTVMAIGLVNARAMLAEMFAGHSERRAARREALASL